MSDRPKTERAMKIAATKARKEAEARTALEAARCAAMRRTKPVARDLPIPECRDTTSGWDINAYGGRVYRAWSASHSHGEGPSRSERYGGSQNGVALFSTKALALAALRYEVERKFADKLLGIDKQITEVRDE